MKILRLTGTCGLCAILVSVFSFRGVSATVPGTNEAIDVNTSGGSPNGYSGELTMNQDGRYVAFVSQATNLVSGVTSVGQIYVRDRLSNSTSIVSVSSSGTPGNSYSADPQISANGRYIVFDSPSTNLVSTTVPGAPYSEVYMHDMTTGTTTLLSQTGSGTIANDTNGSPSVSADGKYVVFTSFANNLVSSPSLTHNYSNIYLKNTTTGTISLLSESSGGSASNATNIQPMISCEGRFVVFASLASNLVSSETNNPNQTFFNVFEADLLNSNSLTDITASANNSSLDPSISCNGSYIAFQSLASNLDSSVSITNGDQNVYTYNTIDASFDLVSISSTSTQANSYSTGTPSISNDGRYVAFASTATNLVAGTTPSTTEIYLRDRQNQNTQFISIASGGTVANASSNDPVISSDNRYVAYESAATNLVSGFSYSGGASFVSQTGATDDY